MEYRKMGKSGLRVSVISFGCMRLTEINQEEADRTVSKAVEAGFNYFETAVGYGDSEIKLGKALGKRRRDVFVSTKSNYNHPEKADVVLKTIENQLSRLQTDYLDFYQMWGADSLDTLRGYDAKGGNLEAVHKLMKQGVIRHVGITSHATPEVLDQIIRSGLFESVTIYHNAYKQEYLPVIKTARELDMGVVCMGPLNGGFLGSNSPELGFMVRGKAANSAQGALRFLVGDSRITTAIVGCKSVKEVEDGAAAGNMYADVAGTSDLREITAAFQKLRNTYPATICSSCDYCKPCPEGIEIPHIFRIFNSARIYGTLDWARPYYQTVGKKADLCAECGACLEKCPQKIDIIRDLAAAHKLLS